MKQISIFILITIVFISCKTDLVYMTVTEPAPVSIPGYVKNVGIIDRSIPAAENKVRNIIDDVLSAKGPELDREGAKESIRGVKDALLQNNRFQTVTFLDKVDIKTAGAGMFPSPMSWDVVEKICKENNVDAIFALELFDTDSKISYSTIPTTLNTPLGGIRAVETSATMATMVKTGWRIYDPQSKLILDEFPISESLTFSGKGVNPLAAASALLDRKEAVKQTGYKVGQTYAFRILPYNIRVNREYYIKGNDNFIMAKRMARAGNWDGAAELWKKETNNTKIKIKQRAYYNMAIISEINGDLDNAIEWSQKSYEMSGKRLSLNYVNILKCRKNENNRLKLQGDQTQ